MKQDRLSIAHCVQSYHPSIGGMQEVVKQLSERIAAMGHEVTVYTSFDPQRRSDPIAGVKVRSFRMDGNVLTGYSGEKEEFLNSLENGGHDVIVLFAAQQWSADLVLEQADRFRAKKILVPTGFSRLHHPALVDYYRNMAKWMKKMDLNIFLSHSYQDIDFARKNGITKLTVIPNGAAEEEFLAPSGTDVRASLKIEKDRPVIVHVGSFTGIKGHEEAIKIFAKAETGDAVLLFAGTDIDVFERKFRKEFKFFRLRRELRRKGKHVVFLKADRSTTVSAMKQADLFLFPSRVECSPIVLFEAMAAGIPFLSSTAGNSEEIVEWSNGGWTMPGTKDEHGWWMIDIEAGAALLTDLLGSPDRLKSAGLAGHAAWRSRFTWQRIAEAYLSEYQKLVHGN